MPTAAIIDFFLGIWSVPDTSVGPYNILIDDYVYSSVVEIYGGEWAADVYEEIQQLYGTDVEDEVVYSSR